jgi:thiamine biosynthesis lipoprotein
MKFKKISIAILCIGLLLTGCQKPVEDTSVSRTQFVLGTVVTIALYEGGSEEILDQVFNRLLEIENLMSANLDASEIGRINSQAGLEPVRVSDETLAVIEKGIYYGQVSDGAFDITMEPVVHLWNIGTEEAKVPDMSVLAQRVAKVDYQKVQINRQDQTVFLPEKGMGLDLGGIAKGYAADEIVRLLEGQGVSEAMLNLGGNVYAMGMKEGASLWKIGIQNPFDSRNAYFGIASIANKSVVTSGPYERYFEEDGKRYHHIFDSSTGLPIENEIASVSVIADLSMDGDALSTTLYAMGIDNGIKLVETLPGVECIFVNQDKAVTISSGLKESFTLENSEYHFAQ